MKRCICFIKNNYKYLFLFIFFLGWNLFVSPLNLDEVWSYGFCYNMFTGLIPYRDFNMVITPFYPFFFGLLFHIFGSSMLVFHILNTIMLVGMFYLVDKLIGDKWWILLLLVCFPLNISFPNYNLLLLFLFIIIIFLEDKKANDYLIGIVIALIILTKHTVGFFFILPSLYYLKDKKKIFKRGIGCGSLILLFVVYLLGTDSFFSFLDLGVLGLFDFATGNGNFLNIFVIFSIILFISVLFLIKKDPNRIENYYFIAFLSILVPLFDLYHFNLVLIAFLIILFRQKDIKLFLNMRLFVSFILCFLVFFFTKDRIKEEIVYPNDIDKFQYRYIAKGYLDFTTSVIEKMDKYSDKKIIFLSADAYYFRLITNQKIGYLDLINIGNWGYNGSDKLMEQVNKSEAVFFVDESELGSSKQTDQRVLKYVIKEGVKIDECYKYNIYVLKR